MKKLLILIVVSFLVSCDGGWKGKLDKQHELSEIEIKFYQTRHCLDSLDLVYLNLRYDSLESKYIKYIKDKNNLIEEMIKSHNKCIHGSPIN